MDIAYLYRLRNVALGWLIWYRERESMCYESRDYDLSDKYEILGNEWQSELEKIDALIAVLTA
jgi:hypothetical protein